MGTYYTSYDIQQSSNSVDIIINGLRGISGDPVVHLRTWLNNSFVQWVEDIDTSWILNYTYTYTGLSSNTSYSFQIEIWSGSTVIDSFSGSFTTTGGGGGGTTPTYTVNTSGSTVYINILNADLSYNRIYTWLNDSYGGRVDYHSLSNTDNDSYTGLADGTYSIAVEYKDDNTDWINLKNDQTGQENTQFTIGGSPTPTGDWSYPTTPTLIISSNSTPIENPYSFNAKQGIFFTFYFQQSGTISVYSSYPSGGLTSYFGPSDTGFDPSNGQPYSYDYYYNGAFTYSYTGNQGDRVYLWVTRDSSRSFTLNVTFSSQPIDTPTYTAQVVNNNQIQIDVSNAGDYYLCYRISLWDDQSQQKFIYDYTKNISVTSGSLDSNTDYAVKVGYASERYGTITWLESQKVTIGGSNFYTQISGITVSNMNVSKPISFSANTGVIVPITISYSGIITVYTERAGSTNMDDFAYLTTSTNVNYSSDGTLDTASPYFIKSDDDSHGNYQFQMTIDNTNVGTNTYYLWIKGYNGSAINTILYATISSGSYVYIYDGSTWRQAVPYIYDGSTWREAIPYVYNGSTWQECGG